MSSRKYELAAIFIGANVVALGAGTPYLYSFYAPQLLKRCHLNIERSSDFSLAMSVGMSAMGFLAGLIIDHSPALASGVGAVLTFMAYSTLYFCYSHEYGNVFLICAALVMVGFGSICSFYAAMKCCTANFPNHRGAAGAFPISQYALSGLVFSAFCSHVFGNDMQSVFLFLTIVCTSTVIVGCFTLRILSPLEPDTKNTIVEVIEAPPVPQDDDFSAIQEESYHSKPIDVLNGKRNSVSSSSNNYKSFTLTASTPSTSSLSSWKRSDSVSSWTKDLVGSLQFWGIGKARPSDSALLPHHIRPNVPRKTSFTIDVTNNERRPSLIEEPNQNSCLLADTSVVVETSTATTQAGVQTTSSKELNVSVNQSPSVSIWKSHPVLKTLLKPRFFAYLLTLATLQGIGQMYIFAVGFVVNTQIQSSDDPQKYNQGEFQSLQVSLISIMSFCGRLVSGPISDVLVKKFKAQRLWVIALSAGLSILASRKLISLNPNTSTTVSNLHNISFSSILFGFSFGMTFGTFPAIIADSFGTDGFSTIWGLSTAGGIISVKALSSVLAKDLAAHMDPDQNSCIKGVRCYIHTFHVTQLWGAFAVSLSLLTLFIGHRNKKVRHHATFTIED